MNMKKIVVLIVATCLSTVSIAQYKLDQGDVQLNAGFGISSRYGNPVSVGLDVGVHRYFSVGAEASFRSYRDSYRDTQQIIGLLANANFHMGGLVGIPDEWDIYMGLSPGVAYRSNSTGVTSFVFGVGGQVGVRYYFTDHFAARLELGGGTLFDQGQIGISYVF
jgi:outer membrane immunogenic protein